MARANRLTDTFTLRGSGSGDSVGARIRLLRHHRGLTQEAFADALGGVSRSAVALWETNRGGEATHLGRIAEVLGVTTEFFINGMAKQNVTETLTMDESALLEMYRGCDAAERLTLLRSAGRLRKRSERQRRPAPAPREET